MRNACALSLVTGTPFRIANVRGGREKPGLMRQHVTAIEAACAIGGATCDGLSVGASQIEFRPGTIVPGEYKFAVGTAGSTGLVLQTILMPLLLTSGPSRLILEGGTHNMLAPPFDFIAKCFLPIIRRMGPQVDARLVRHGFYPRGGGRIEIDIQPAALGPIACVERGDLVARSALAIFAALPFEVADREIKTVKKLLDWPDEAYAVHELPEEQGPGNMKKLLDWPDEAYAVHELPEEQGPGNILLLEAEFEHVTEIVSGFGKLGVPAEQIAKRAAGRMAGYLESDAFAGPYLADQLLLPFALAGGGEFTTVKPSQHSLTAVEIIAKFLGRSCKFEIADSGVHRLSVER